ncbi:MAG: MarR family transcriptional regulator [Bacillota bacterium]|nr:MarR family transcriptional regulator [Bacillota bacterium]
MELKTFWDFISEFDESYHFHRKRIMNRFELSAIEVDVLLFVANNPELDTSSDFSRLRKIAKSHVSLAVNSLSEKGYLEKKEDEKNRKKIHLVPTKKADDIVAFGRKEQKEFAQAIQQGILEDEKEIMRNTMKRISQNLQTQYNKRK